MTDVDLFYKNRFIGQLTMVYLKHFFFYHFPAEILNFAYCCVYIKSNPRSCNAKLIGENYLFDDMQNLTLFTLSAKDAETRNFNILRLLPNYLTSSECQTKLLLFIVILILFSH